MSFMLSSASNHREERTRTNLSVQSRRLAENGGYEIGFDADEGNRYILGPKLSPTLTRLIYADCDGGHESG